MRWCRNKSGILTNKNKSIIDGFFSPYNMWREATAHLCECHPGDDSQHDLFPFSRVWVLLVLLQPGFQGTGRLSGGCLGPRRVSVRILAVSVEALRGVNRKGGRVRARALLQLVLWALIGYRGDNLLSHASRQLSKFHRLAQKMCEIIMTKINSVITNDH